MIYVSPHLQKNPADLHPQADAFSIRTSLVGNTAQGSEESGGDICSFETSVTND